MALSDSDKISSVYKKLLGIAETSTSKAFFEEPFTTGTPVTPDMVWRDAHAIPATAPDISPTYQDIDGEMVTFGMDGVVGYFQWLPLLPVDGSPKSFYHRFLKNAITFNFDPAGSYIYRLRNQAGFDIAFGVQDWVVDPIAGTLTFYGNNLGSIGVSPSQPPQISFFQYRGRTGFPSGGGAGGAELPIADIDTLLFKMGFPTHLARFEVNGGDGTTVYQLPPVEGGGQEGKLLLEENLNTTINTIGVVDGGEHT